MTVTTRKYNPGFLSDDELVASFCVRTAEYRSLVETLRECSGSANSHQIVIGPRGSGKTSLLLRVAVEARRDADLSARFFPIRFAEESYGVCTAGEFWLECVSRLAGQVPWREGEVDLQRAFEDLRGIHDDRMLEDRCLGALQDFADRENKRLVLIVENLNMMFRDMADVDAGWRLRKVLQTEPRIVLLASATSRFDQIDDPNEALYEQFRVIRLRSLDRKDCSTLWRTVSGQARPPQTIQALRILTGGSPRLLTILARFGGNLSFRELMDDLLDLVDDHTEYFKSHLDSLPAQERKVYLALADLWKPANTREVADRARLGTSQCSAQLARLIGRGAVEVSGGSSRRKLYYLTERLYNIYYLMRRAHGPAPLVDALIRFMEAYYSADDLRVIGIRMAREVLGGDDGAKRLYRMVFDRLVGLAFLGAHREELRLLVWPALADADGEFPAASTVLSGANDPLGKAMVFANGSRLQDAVATWDEVTRRFKESDCPTDPKHVAVALVNKGTALEKLGDAEGALAAWDDVVRQFEGRREDVYPLAVANAIASKGRMLSAMNQHKEALAAWSEVVRRFRGSRVPALERLLANAWIGMAVELYRLDRHEDALEACDEMLKRFGEDCSSDLQFELAVSMVGRGHVLIALNRVEEAIREWCSVVERFGSSCSPEIAEQVASALENAGTAIFRLGRYEEALAIWQDMESRFGNSNNPELVGLVVRSFHHRCASLFQMNRTEEVLAICDQAVERLEGKDLPADLAAMAKILVDKGIALTNLHRNEEALAVWGEIERRFKDSDEPKLLKSVASSLVGKGFTFVNMNRLDDAVEAWSDVVLRFAEKNASLCQREIAIAIVYRVSALDLLGRSEEEVLDSCNEALRWFRRVDDLRNVEAMAQILVIKGDLLVALDRSNEGFAAWDEVVRRFEANDTPALRNAAELALYGRARQELIEGHASAAISLLDRALLQSQAGMPESRLQGYLVRAQAHLAEGDGEACAGDVEKALSILPDLSDLPKDVLTTLSALSTGTGMARMCDLIKSSPARDTLLPLTTAMEKELGLEPRVAREVEEIAEDIRREFFVGGGKEMGQETQ